MLVVMWFRFLRNHEAMSSTFPICSQEFLFEEILILKCASAPFYVLVIFCIGCPPKTQKSMMIKSLFLKIPITKKSTSVLTVARATIKETLFQIQFVFTQKTSFFCPPAHTHKRAFFFRQCRHFSPLLSSCFCSFTKGTHTSQTTLELLLLKPWRQSWC